MLMHCLGGGDGGGSDDDGVGNIEDDDGEGNSYAVVCWGQQCGSGGGMNRIFKWKLHL